MACQIHCSTLLTFNCTTRRKKWINFENCLFLLCCLYPPVTFIRNPQSKKLNWRKINKIYDKTHLWPEKGLKGIIVVIMKIEQILGYRWNFHCKWDLCKKTALKWHAECTLHRKEGILKNGQDAKTFFKFGFFSWNYIFLLCKLVYIFASSSVSVDLTYFCIYASTSVYLCICVFVYLCI